MDQGLIQKYEPAAVVLVLPRLLNGPVTSQPSRQVVAAFQVAGENDMCNDVPATEAFEAGASSPCVAELRSTIGGECCEVEQGAEAFRVVVQKLLAASSEVCDQEACCVWLHRGAGLEARVVYISTKPEPATAGLHQEYQKCPAPLAWSN